jgi:hypothetical protein
MAPFTAVPANLIERVVDLDARIYDVKVLRYNASNLGNAAQFGRLDRWLDALYAERDGLAPRDGEVDRAARLVAARRRAAR